MPTYNSPGVYTSEKDFSNFDPASSPTTPGIVGFASQGPVDKPTLITNTVDLERYFGMPTETTGGQGLLGAYEIMRETGQLMFVRAQTTAASRAEVDVPLGGCPFVLVGHPDNAETAVKNNLFNPANSGSTTSGSVDFVVAVSGSNGTATTSKPYFLTIADCNSVDTVVSAFQRTLTDQNDFSIEKLDDTYCAFVGAYPGSNAVIEVSAFHPSGVCTIANFKATELSGHGAIGGGGNLLSRTVGGNYVQYDGTFADVRAKTGVDGAGGWTDIGSPGTGDLSGMQVVSGMFYNSFNSYSIASNADLSGTNFKMNATTTSSHGRVSGCGVTFAKANSAGGAYTVRALHTGQGYNAVSSYNGTTQVERGLSLRVENTGKLQQSLVLLRGGGVEESYKVQLIEESSAMPTWPSSVINNKQYGSGETSDYIYGAFENTDTDVAVTWTAPSSIFTATNSYVASPSGTSTGNSRFLKFESATYDFSGGANGDAGDHGGSMTNSEVVNALAGPTGTYRGVKAFSPETVDVDIVAIPGVHVQDVQSAAITAAESKGKFLYITSPPEGLSPQEAVDWHNGNYPGRTVTMNSSYAALYYPHCKFFNTFAGVDQYMDPAVFAIKAMSKADNVAEVWNATAGVTRGKISPTVKEVEKDLNQGDRDYVYGGGNALNPIINFKRHGICIWGQRTTQRLATALDRINVRRLAIAIRQKVQDLGMPFVFEPNDPITWSLIVGEITPMLEDIQGKRGIRSFRVFCDETTNTPLRVDRGELWVKIEVVPTKSAEALIFEINVLGQEEA